MSTRRGIRVCFPGGVESDVESDDARKVHSRVARRWVGSADIWHHLFRYRYAVGLVGQSRFVPQCLMIYVFLRVLSRGGCWLEMPDGSRQQLGIGFGLRRLGLFFRDLLTRRRLLGEVASDVDRRLGGLASKLRSACGSGHRVLYLRTDLWFGIRAGGSVGHIAGVVNQLQRLGHAPLLLTTERIPTVVPEVDSEVVLPADRWVDFAELSALAFSAQLHQQVLSREDRDAFAFIYQRYGTGNYSGVLIADSLAVPLVLEYNGSEVWITRNWGTGLVYQGLSEQIETLNLRSANLVVVVSEVLRDELVERGVEPHRVLVNPNGVDPDCYHPDVDGSEIRERYGLGDSLVIGFIGTFGPWHGAEVLPDAFAKLLRDHPTLDVKLLLVGDGVRMAEVRERIDAAGIADRVILTGIVPQQEGPAHLAASDLLVSPHVPNPDGSRFFGSPTKLFEYMAMERAIVASDLEQIGDILEHDRSALLVPPGDVDALAVACAELLADPERRQRLAGQARQRVVQQHSWAVHTQRIVDALAELDEQREVDR